MKKVLIIILSLALMLTFAACGEKNGGKSPSESSAPAESVNPPSSKAGADENKYYGIGEAAEYEEYRITIDKVERVSDTSIFWNPKEGYSYIKVYVTVENIDTEAVSVDETPLCIVRDGDYNAELSDYSRNTDVINFLQDGIFEEAYLAPGTAESGWLTFQIKPDEKELTMKYDQLFDTVFFRFTVE
jgi:predicted small lipoprotein YifL